MIPALWSFLPLLCFQLARSTNILVVYYSQGNHTKNLAAAIAQGSKDEGATVRLLSIAEASYERDVKWADGVLVGSPVHNADIAAPLKQWLDAWNYLKDNLSDKFAAPFATGGHLYGGIESTLLSLRRFFNIFGMRVISGEKDFQPNFPFGVGATTFDPPFNNNSNVPGFVDPIFLQAGQQLGRFITQIASKHIKDHARSHLVRTSLIPSQLPVVFVTEADSAEQFGLASSLLQKRSGKGVVAGVVNASSANAQVLAQMGAELRQIPDPPPVSAFSGVDWLFLIPPNDEQRLSRGKKLISAAMSAQVPNALLLSVVGVDAVNAPASILAYLELERMLTKQWPGGYTGLRTAFYQQNLLFWSSNSRASGKLRLPFTHCFAPLYMGDVADVVATLTSNRILPPQYNRINLNLTGPETFSGAVLAATASSVVGATLMYEKAARSTAEQILAATGELSVEEVGVILDMLAIQTQGATCAPSEDFMHVTGKGATNVTTFFRENKAAFVPTLPPIMLTI